MTEPLNLLDEADDRHIRWYISDFEDYMDYMGYDYKFEELGNMYSLKIKCANNMIIHVPCGVADLVLDFSNVDTHRIDKIIIGPHVLNISSNLECFEMVHVEEISFQYDGYSSYKDRLMLYGLTNLNVGAVYIKTFKSTVVQFSGCFNRCIIGDINIDSSILWFKSFNDTKFSNGIWDVSSASISESFNNLTDTDICIICTDKLNEIDRSFNSLEHCGITFKTEYGTPDILKVSDSFNDAVDCTISMVDSNICNLYASFKSCNKCRISKLPDSINYIGYDSFMGTDSLHQITITNNTKAIDFKFIPYTVSIELKLSSNVLDLNILKNFSRGYKFINNGSPIKALHTKFGILDIPADISLTDYIFDVESEQNSILHTEFDKTSVFDSADYKYINKLPNRLFSAYSLYELYIRDNIHTIDNLGLYRARAVYIGEGCKEINTDTFSEITYVRLVVICANDCKIHENAFKFPRVDIFKPVVIVEAGSESHRQLQNITTIHVKVVQDMTVYRDKNFNFRAKHIASDKVQKRMRMCMDDDIYEAEIAPYITYAGLAYEKYRLSSASTESIISPDTPKAIDTNAFIGLSGIDNHALVAIISKSLGTFKENRRFNGFVNFLGTVCMPTTEQAAVYANDIQRTKIQQLYPIICSKESYVCMINMKYIVIILNKHIVYINKFDSRKFSMKVEQKIESNRILNPFYRDSYDIFSMDTEKCIFNYIEAGDYISVYSNAMCIGGVMLDMHTKDIYSILDTLEINCMFIGGKKLDFKKCYEILVYDMMSQRFGLLQSKYDKHLELLYINDVYELKEYSNISEYIDIFKSCFGENRA